MSTPNDQMVDLPIACDLSAIPDVDRAAHLARATALFGADDAERRELADGYAWRFAGEQYDEVTAYIANERRCCPFFTFVLEVTPAGGPLWLRITGTAAMKALLQAELLAHDGA